jgi:hypothetical protein
VRQSSFAIRSWTPGAVETASFDFKGNALSWSRRLATAITAEPDWTAMGV